MRIISLIVRGVGRVGWGSPMCCFVLLERGLRKCSGRSVAADWRGRLRRFLQSVWSTNPARVPLHVEESSATTPGTRGVWRTSESASTAVSSSSPSGRRPGFAGNTSTAKGIEEAKNHHRTHCVWCFLHCVC